MTQQKQITLAVVTLKTFHELSLKIEIRIKIMQRVSHIIHQGLFLQLLLYCSRISKTETNPPWCVKFIFRL